MGNYIMEGTFIFTPSKDKFEVKEDSFLVVLDNKVEGIYKEIPSEYSSLKVIDNKGKIIIPGFVDLHVHAPQYKYRSTGMDLELLDWLNTYTFPEESKFKDNEYAKRIYSTFVEELKRGPSTRLCLFATIHREATLTLMDLLEKSGLSTYVGKVNMDRNSPDYLIETTEESIEETKNWIEESRKRGFKNTKPILTPRFTPSCSDELMMGLKKITEEYDVPFQSHLSENDKEIEWVKQLEPQVDNYGEAYNQFGLFGGDVKTIMAHCVSSPKEEIQLMKDNGVFVAHSPESNMNIRSGIAPISMFLKEGLKVGLATDMAGGSSPDMFRAISCAIQASKLYWRLVDDSYGYLSTSEAFYLATKGGGEFFGKVGSFESGFEFDAVVLDDSSISFSDEFSPSDRLEKMIYLADSSNVVEKYVSGVKVL
ncbi:MAG: amidohydrolase family protein [Sphaerochaeta sp.]